MSTFTLPNPEIDETKILKLLALAGLGRRLLPTAWLTPEGRCSCVTKSMDREADRICSQGNKPGKHPLITEWQKRATTDQDEIISWHRWRPLANWAWLQDETFALDVDPKRGGLESLAQWEENAGGPWPTLTARTQSGGWHFIYRQPDEPIRVQGDILPGIEVRGLGSYIMVEPSVGLDGKWEFVDPGKTPAEADEDTLQLIHRHGLLLELDARTGASDKRESGEASTLPRTEYFMRHGFGGYTGSRNVDAYRLAWRLLALGDSRPGMYPVGTITGIMKTCWLATEQGSDPFSWDECLGALRSAWRRRERQKLEQREEDAKLAEFATSLTRGVGVSL